MVYLIDVARLAVQFAVLVFINARLFGVAPSGAFVPYLQPSGSPFTIVHGAYDAIEIALSHTVFPFLAVAFVSHITHHTAQSKAKAKAKRKATPPHNHDNTTE